MSWAAHSASVRPRGLKPAALSLILLLSVLGCRQQAPPKADAVRDVVERGALKFTVEVRPGEVWLGDQIEITLHVHTPEDYFVQLPTAEAFDEMEVRSVDSPDPHPALEGGLDWRRSFTVESYTSGTLEIPPLVVKYACKPTEAGAEPQYESELVTGTLEIEVRSALTTQDSVTQPRDITGTLTPPQSRRFWPWAVLATVLVGLTVAVYLLVQHVRRRRALGPPPPAPEVWALRMLAQLRVEEVETGGARVFYYLLSEIVRAYIERKFALTAPEMTTEEFLATLARDHTTLPYDADQLRVFLEACDIVKYAAFNPRREDAEQALRTARAFVNETAAAAERAARQAAVPAGQTSGGQAA